MYHALRVALGAGLVASKTVAAMGVPLLTHAPPITPAVMITSRASLPEPKNVALCGQLRAGKVVGWYVATGYSPADADGGTTWTAVGLLPAGGAVLG